MSVTFATITNRMRLDFFSHNHTPEPDQSSAPPPVAATAKPPTGKTFPADEIVWGIVIRNGFDELDDPWYHRGTTQHAYLEGHDNVAICGFRPPQSGARSRRRSRLGLPTPGEHPMCGMCARMVVAPRPRVPVPVGGSRAPVVIPVARSAAMPAQSVPAAQSVPVAQPVPVAAAPVAAAPPATPSPAAAPRAGAATTSPWVRQLSDVDEADGDSMTIELSGSHDTGLLKRGVHTEINED